MPTKTTEKPTVTITGPKASQTLRTTPAAEYEPLPCRVRVGQQFTGENVVVTNPKAGR